MKHGFTLLELSIVLVVIGLVIGGITAGQSLIRSADLNNAITDIEKYRAAVANFELKYDSLPGDMSNAQSIWPSCVDNGSNSCNGNEDNVINTSSTIFEYVRFWQHLALAGLIEGNYSGIPADVPDLLNNPLAIQYITFGFLDKDDTNRVYAKTHLFSQSFGLTDLDEITMGQLDEKFDDSFPLSGKILIFIDGSSSNCLISSAGRNRYDLRGSGDYDSCFPSFTMK